jgi:hypothetical protein
MRIPLTLKMVSVLDKTQLLTRSPWGRRGSSCLVLGQITGLYEQQIQSVLSYLNDEMTWSTAKAEIRCTVVLSSPALGMLGTLAPLAFTS